MKRRGHKLVIPRVITTALAAAVVLTVIGEAPALAAPKPPTAAEISAQNDNELIHIAVDKRPRGEADLDELRTSLHVNGLQTTKSRWVAEGKDVDAELQKLGSGYVRFGHHEHVFMWDKSAKGIDGASGIERNGDAVRVKIRWKALEKDGISLKGDSKTGPPTGLSENGAWTYKGDIPRKYLYIEGVDSSAHPGFKDWLAGRGWPDGNGICAPEGAAGRAKRSADACSIGAKEPQTPVRDHDELARTHQERLKTNKGDVEYVTSLEEFEKNPKALLSPLRETNKVLNEAEAAQLGAKDFETFSAKVTEAFGRDLQAVHGLTTDTGLLTKVGRQIGRAGEFGAKALPYVGIAATGYAIAEDEKAGDYANLAFDSVAEGLQVAMVAQPEFTPVLEPVLLVEQLGQLFYNEIAGWIAQQEQLNHERAEWDNAAKDLVEHRNGQWRNHLMGQAGNNLFPQLNEKFVPVLKSDKDTLVKWADAKKRAVTRISEQSQKRASSAEEKQRIGVHAAALKHSIDAKMYKHLDDRVKMYEQQIVDIATTAFASTLKPGKDGKLGKDGKSAFDSFNDEFFEKSVKPYLDKLEDRISRDEAPRNGASWNQARLTRYQEAWKRKMEAKLDEVRADLSREGRTTMSRQDIQQLQQDYFPAKDVFRAIVRDERRTVHELSRDKRD